MNGASSKCIGPWSPACIPSCSSILQEHTWLCEHQTNHVQARKCNFTLNPRNRIFCRDFIYFINSWIFLKKKTFMGTSLKIQVLWLGFIWPSASTIIDEISLISLLVRRVDKKKPPEKIELPSIKYSALSSCSCERYLKFLIEVAWFTLSTVRLLSSLI